MKKLSFQLSIPFLLTLILTLKSGPIFGKTKTLDVRVLSPGIITKNFDIKSPLKKEQILEPWSKGKLKHQDLEKYGNLLLNSLLKAPLTRGQLKERRKVFSAWQGAYLDLYDSKLLSLYFNLYFHFFPEKVPDLNPFPKKIKKEMMVFLNKSKSKEILIILPKNIQSLRLHSKPLKTQRFYLPKYLKTPLFFEVKKGKKSSFFRISKLPKSGIYFLTLKAKEQNINGFEKLSLKSLCLERAVHQIKIIKEGFKNQKIHCLPTAVKAKKPIKSIAKEPLKWIFLSGLSFGSLKQSSEKGWDLGIELGLAIEKSWFFTKLSSSYFLPKDHNLEKEFKNLGNQKFQLNRDFLSIDLSVGSHLNIANMKILFGPNLSFIYVLRQNYHQNLVAIEEIPLPDNKFLNAGGLFEASWSFYKDLSLALNLKIGHKMQSLSLLVGKSNP